MTVDVNALKPVIELALENILSAKTLSVKDKKVFRLILENGIDLDGIFKSIFEKANTLKFRNICKLALDFEEEEIIQVFLVNLPEKIDAYLYDLYPLFEKKPGLFKKISEIESLKGLSAKIAFGSFHTNRAQLALIVKEWIDTKAVSYLLSTTDKAMVNRLSCNYDFIYLTAKKHPDLLNALIEKSTSSRLLVQLAFLKENQFFEKKLSKKNANQIFNLPEYEHHNSIEYLRFKKNVFRCLEMGAKLPLDTTDYPYKPHSDILRQIQKEYPEWERERLSKLAIPSAVNKPKARL